MTSLRKRVSSYFRQLSFHNEPRDKRKTINENTFINKYLTGEIKLKEGPPVLHGKTPNDLPNFELGAYTTGYDNIVGCSTGPNGGLTTVKRTEKHLSIPDADIDFIDTQDDPVVEQQQQQQQKQKSPVPLRHKTPMKIKVAGQTYIVSSNLKKHAQNRNSRSLGSLQDVSIDAPPHLGPHTNNNNTECSTNNTETSLTNNCDANSNNSGAATCTNTKDSSDMEEQSYALSKSKSAGSALDRNKKGKIIRLSQRPGTQGSVDASNTRSELPQKWDKKTDYVYGLSDSLYDTNQVTKIKNGNPIADCFGVIARADSAILALADGVNWGEKASIAAKSAIHGCLHYLNKTIFDDASMFEFNNIDAKQIANTPINTNFDKTGLPTLGDNQITNTNEVFVCLLRAFNNAHNLILENDGMLTTLTVAVVLPLKSNLAPDAASPKRRRFICCVCNVGDTFAYVYSPRFGVREVTKGSHDVHSNRDMRDALGALGPVDGINPELNNLTLSVTTLDAGDIVMIASDGLTDNYDPTVCRFTANQNINATTHQKDRPKTKPNLTRHTSSNTSSSVKPSNISRLAKDTNITAKNKTTKNPVSNSSKDETDFTGNNHPLVAQFLLDNALDDATKNKTEDTKPPPARTYRRVVSMVNPKTEPTPSVGKENKTTKHSAAPLSKSSSASRVLKQTKTNVNQTSFLRSKTSIDFNQTIVNPKQITRNDDGLPYVTPIQKYELTLLLMEDILLRGISGRDKPCVTAKILCENLLRYTISITAAKRRTLEDVDLYYDNKNDVLVEVSAREKKSRRKRCLEKVQQLPGKLDHVTVVAYNVGNTVHVA